MIKNKIASVAMAGVLAMGLGLTACGGNNAASKPATTQAATTAAATTAAATTPDASTPSPENKIVYWEGTLADGQIVSYLDNGVRNVAALTIVKPDYSDGKVWAGSSSGSGSVVTVTDKKTQETISYTIEDISLTSFKINLDGYGEVELKPVTEAHFKAFAEEVAAKLEEGAKVLAAAIDEAATEVNNLVKEFEATPDTAILFWTGDLADGRHVIFSEDAQAGEASISVIKADLTDASVWSGKTSAATDGKVTITDDEDKTTVSYTVVKAATETDQTINIEGYGEVALKAATKADLMQLLDEVAQELNQQVNAATTGAAATAEATTTSSN